MSFYTVVQTETFKQPKVSCYPRFNGISPQERCSAVRQMTNAYGDLASIGFVVARGGFRKSRSSVRMAHKEYSAMPTYADKANAIAFPPLIIETTVASRLLLYFCLALASQIPIPHARGLV